MQGMQVARRDRGWAWEEEGSVFIKMRVGGGRAYRMY